MEALTDEELGKLEVRVRRGQRPAKRSVLSLLAEVHRLRALCADQRFSDGGAVLLAPEKSPPVNWGTWATAPGLGETPERLDRLAHESLRRVGNGEINYVILGDHMIVVSKARQSDDCRRFLCRIEKWNYTFAPREQPVGADEEEGEG